MTRLTRTLARRLLKPKPCPDLLCWICLDARHAETIGDED